VLRQTILIGVQGFDEFWECYLKKVARKPAEQVWRRLNPSSDLQMEIRTALAWQFQQQSWLKDNHQYAPNASTYLNGERWKDPKPKPTITTVSRHTATPIVVQQLDASARIRALVATGMDPETAKRQIYREIGWIRE
jgi:hypothetical protein